MIVDISKEDHRQLKILAVASGKNMKDLVVEWIHERLYGSHIPNAKTLKAIEQVEKRENLVFCKDISNLFKNS